MQKYACAYASEYVCQHISNSSCKFQCSTYTHVCLLAHTHFCSIHAEICICLYYVCVCEIFAASSNAVHTQKYVCTDVRVCVCASACDDIHLKTMVAKVGFATPSSRKLLVHRQTKKPDVFLQIIIPMFIPQI